MARNVGDKNLSPREKRLVAEKNVLKAEKATQAAKVKVMEAKLVEKKAKPKAK